MNRKIMLLMLISLLSAPTIRIESRPPLMVDDGTSFGGESNLSLEYFMESTDKLPAPSTDKPSGLKIFCQSIGLIILMKIADFTNWCQRSCKTFLEQISRYTLPRS